MLTIRLTFMCLTCCRWGDHYWMVEMEMDCSQAVDGWFEVKAFLTNTGNIFQ